MSRYGNKITRSDYAERDTSDRVSWIDTFADHLAAPKTAVEAARARDQQSYLDQISNTFNNAKAPSYNTVENKVQEMQERVGLKEYLQRQAKIIEESREKTAQETTNNEVFSNLSNDVKENVINFLKNTIKTRHGLISVPALVSEIASIFKNQGVQQKDVENSDVYRFINKLIIEENRQNTTNNVSEYNIGNGVGVSNDDKDQSNTDFFAGLMPLSKT